MKPGETAYIGDGAYLHFDGYGFEFRANHHEAPTDRVYIDGSDVPRLIKLLSPPVAELAGIDAAIDELANR
jgi:hypothetical protein